MLFWNLKKREKRKRSRMGIEQSSRKKLSSAELLADVQLTQQRFSSASPVPTSPARRRPPLPQVPALLRSTTQPAVLQGAGWLLPLEHLHFFEISKRNQRLEGYTRASSAPHPPPEQDAVSESAADSAWREAWKGRLGMGRARSKGRKMQKKKENRFA